MLEMEKLGIGILGVSEVGLPGFEITRSDDQSDAWSCAIIIRTEIEKHILNSVPYVETPALMQVKGDKTNLNIMQACVHLVSPTADLKA